MWDRRRIGENEREGRERRRDGGSERSGGLLSHLTQIHRGFV